MYQTNIPFSKLCLLPTRRGKKKQLKHLTVPRLELLAMLIGVRAANFVQRELRVEISEKIV